MTNYYLSLYETFEDKSRYVVVTSTEHVPMGIYCYEDAYASVHKHVLRCNATDYIKAETTKKGFYYITLWRAIALGEGNLIRAKLFDASRVISFLGEAEDLINSSCLPKVFNLKKFRTCH
jgi:hypothetical protein